MSEIPMIRCPVCGAELKVTTSTSKRGNVALVLVCSASGRDFRAFINNKTYVRKVLDSLEEGARSTPPAEQQASRESDVG